MVKKKKSSEKSIHKLSEMVEDINKMAKPIRDIDKKISESRKIMATAPLIPEIPKFEPPPQEWPFLKELVEQTNILIEQNDIFNKLIGKQIDQTKEQIEQTKNLIEENKKVGKLTKWLIGLTIVLVICTIVLIYYTAYLVS